MVRQALELAPVSKLLYASDAARTPELYYLAATWWRAALAEVLGRGAAAPDEAERGRAAACCARTRSRSTAWAERAPFVRDNGRSCTTSSSSSSACSWPWPAWPLARAQSTSRTRSCSWSAGCCSGFVPGMPDVELEPELVLVIFLPPLLYSAAFFANLHELRAQRARRSR